MTAPIHDRAGAAFAVTGLTKRLRTTVQTVQTIGIEWADYVRHSRERTLVTAGSLAKAGSPSEAFEIQCAYLREAGEQFAVRVATFRGLYATLAGQPAKPVGGLTPTTAG